MQSVSTLKKVKRNALQMKYQEDLYQQFQSISFKIVVVYHELK